MKLAMVMLTRNDDTGVIVNGENMGQPVAVTVSHRNLRVCLLLLLACTAGLSAGSWWYELYPASSAQPTARLQYAPGAQRILVESWNRVDPLHKGERVVLAAPITRNIRVEQVAATPHEAVVLRRGQALDSLFVLGADRYFVTAANGAGRVVNAEQIHGVYRGTGATGL